MIQTRRNYSHDWISRGWGVGWKFERVKEWKRERERGGGERERWDREGNHRYEGVTKLGMRPHRRTASALAHQRKQSKGCERVGRQIGTASYGGRWRSMLRVVWASLSSWWQLCSLESWVISGNWSRRMKQWKRRGNCDSGDLNINLKLRRERMETFILL